MSSSAKYQIGDRLSYDGKDIKLIIRGVMPISTGFRYFIQVDDKSDNSFTLNDSEMEEMIERCAVTGSYQERWDEIPY
jgi:hypothetical protein